MQMQRKYLDQFYVLYDDFNITKLPLLPQEVYIFSCIFVFVVVSLWTHHPICNLK